METKAQELTQSLLAVAVKATAQYCTWIDGLAHDCGQCDETTMAQCEEIRNRAYQNGDIVTVVDENPIAGGVRRKNLRLKDVPKGEPTYCYDNFEFYFED
jgi:hypothetical protein